MAVQPEVPGSGGARARAGPVTYEVLTDLADVEFIAPGWEGLLYRSPCNRAFSSSHWFLSSAYAMGWLAPYVLTAWRERDLAGVLPLTLRKGSETARFPALLCDYQDIIAEADDAAVLRGLLKLALHETNSYQRLCLDWIRQDSNCAAALRLLNPRYVFTPRYRRYVCPYVRLPSNYSAYLLSRNAKSRARLRQLERQAARRGASIRRLPDDVFPAERIADHFLTLQFERFGAQSGFARPEHADFVRNLLPELFCERKAEALALCKGKRMLAISIQLSGERSHCLWNGGFARDAAGLSAGTLLIYAAIERACELGLGEFDFLAGQEAYKSRWSTHFRHLSSQCLSVSGCGLRTE